MRYGRKEDDGCAVKYINGADKRLRDRLRSGATKA